MTRLGLDPRTLSVLTIRDKLVSMEKSRLCVVFFHHIVAFSPDIMMFPRRLPPSPTFTLGVFLG